MPPTRLQIDLTPSARAAFAARLAALNSDMDHAYAAAAARYGFECTGCTDNCCRTHFKHHTLLEYLCLEAAFQDLGSALQAELKQRAAVVCRRASAAARRRRPLREMCPLNVEGSCRLYRQRPLICRLHGLPHELRRGTGGVVYAPGCEAFTARCGQKAYVQFDRTPLYARMAALEGELRREAACRTPLKMTVAEMILVF